MRFEELAVGMSAEWAKTVTEADVVLYAGITGDFNPAHVDQAAAERSRFGGRIAHGMLSAGFISAALAMRLPGPGTIY
jgi:3-hydroxybutyryl-CoA dehydratase